MILNCVIFGGGQISIRVDDAEQDTVAILKDAIKDKMKNRITTDSDGLELYLAMKNTKWMSVTDSDIMRLRHNADYGGEE
ncbi:unnamed protein product [Phytophthora lilii]|uniref:Unnamed protein product n=1 Tax=Phytophthora lilii TaxID=2077276 RepID=A0A9W6WPF1_9STRA|nr:unnamed protein product [Phytophthora lilii]